MDAIHGDDETRRGGAAADDPASLAEKLEQILAEPHLREALADNGYHAVHRDFTAARMAGGFEAVCLSAMEENSLPHAPVPAGL